MAAVSLTTSQFPGVSEVFTMEMSLLLFFHQTHGEQPCQSCSIFCSRCVSAKDIILKLINRGKTYFNNVLNYSVVLIPIRKKVIKIEN